MHGTSRFTRHYIIRYLSVHVSLSYPLQLTCAMIQTILPVCEVKIWLEHLSTIVTSASPQLLADFYYRPLLHRLSTTYVIVMFQNVTEGIQAHRHVVALLRHSAEVHRCAAECSTHCRCSTALQEICKLISVHSL